MIVDTSAIIAILSGEADAPNLAGRLDQSSINRMSAASYLEAAIVADRKQNPVLSRRFDALMVDLAVKIEPVTEHHARIAREAYRDFGKGSGHPARLNFGDCFSYALARAANEALLFKGDNFSKTDVIPAR